MRTHLQRKVKEAVTYLAQGCLSVDPGQAALIETRRSVERGWRGVIQLLEGQDEKRLAESVSRFVAAMRPPRTEREAMADRLIEHLRQTCAQKLELTR